MQPKLALAALCLAAVAARSTAYVADASFATAPVDMAETLLGSSAVKLPAQLEGYGGAIYSHVFSLEMDDHFDTLSTISVADKSGDCLEWKLVDKWRRAKETYGAVYHNSEIDTLVFTFRGTKNFQNVMTDIDAAEKSCTINYLSCGRIHKGFSASYDQIKDDVKETIRSFSRPQHIVFVGHSLGGALSTIATMDVITSYNLVANVASVSLFTTGSPQVGNKKFAEAFQSLGVNSYRTVDTGTGNDPVTELPGALGTVLAATYKHIQDPTKVKCPKELSTAGIKCFLGDLHEPLLYFGGMKKLAPGHDSIGLCKAKRLH